MVYFIFLRTIDYEYYTIILTDLSKKNKKCKPVYGCQ